MKQKLWKKNPSVWVRLTVATGLLLASFLVIEGLAADSAFAQWRGV
jgi:hypothetical protein